jgi:hypothetical protein
MAFVSLIADAQIFLLPRWMKRVLGRIPDAPSGGPIGRAGTADESWTEFMEGAAMKSILKAVRPRQLPHVLGDWELPLRTAMILFNHLEDERLADLPSTVYPTLCLLVKGYYYIKQNGKKGRRRLFSEDPNSDLIHAAASIDCSLGFMERLLKDHSKQLTQLVNGMTPLHIILEKPDLSFAMVQLFVSVSPECASMKYKDELPFHQACRHGYQWEYGLKELFEAHPDVMITAGPSPLYLVASTHATTREREEREGFLYYHAEYHRSHLLYSQEAAKKAKRDLAVLNTLFELLTKDPTIVRDLKVVKARGLHLPF